MAALFEQTKDALRTFKEQIECARCEQGRKDLQYIGVSCKHAFCWDCITAMTSETSKRRSMVLCPRCALQLNMNKIAGASVLNSCGVLLDELAELLDEFEKIGVSDERPSHTQRILDTLAVNERVRTVDEFLLTQPADLDISEERENIKLNSKSPEIDGFGYERYTKDVKFEDDDFDLFNDDEIAKPEPEKPMPLTRKSTKRPSVFDEDDNSPQRTRSSAAKAQKTDDVQMGLFCSQVPERHYDNTSITPFINRRPTAPSPSISGLISSFSEPLRSVGSTRSEKADDAFTKKISLPRRNTASSNCKDNSREGSEEPSAKRSRRGSTPKESVVAPKRETPRTRQSTITSTSNKRVDETKNQEEVASKSRSNSPSSFSTRSTHSPRRSSLGIRRGEQVIINSIAQNRIPQLKSAIEAGSSVNEKDRRGFTPLYTAVERRNMEAVKILIEAGAVINASCGSTCETALHEAVRQEDAEIVDYLLAKGASIKLKNSWQTTAEDLLTGDKKELKKVFAKYSNVPHPLQPVIPPRRPRMWFVQLLDEKIFSENDKKKLPGKINLVTNNDFGITHLVVEIDAKTQTLEITKETLADVLRTIMRPAMLVSTLWLKACIRDERRVDEDKKYEIRKMRLMDGPIVEGSAEKWRRTDDRMNPKLFAGCKFFFLRSKYNQLDRTTLVELVRLGGGEVVVREPLIEGKEPPPYHNAKLQPNFVVYSITHPVLEKFRDTSRFTLICEQWLIDSIINFSLSATPY